MATYPVKLHSSTLKIIARDVGGYSYSYGNAIPVIHEAEISDLLEAGTPEQADAIAVMIRHVAGAALRKAGKPADLANAAAAEPLNGCTMVAFYEPGKGVESARVTLTHSASQLNTIGYDRTINAALRSANAAMERLLKRT